MRSSKYLKDYYKFKKKKTKENNFESASENTERVFFKQ